MQTPIRVHHDDLARFIARAFETKGMSAADAAVVEAHRRVEEAGERLRASHERLERAQTAAQEAAARLAQLRAEADGQRQAREAAEAGRQRVEAELEGWTIITDTPAGRLHHLGPVVRLSETPARWARPTVPLGYHEPVWPARTA